MYSLDPTPVEMAQKLALKHKALRRQLKMSQTEMAERSCVSPGSLKRFERSGNLHLTHWQIFRFFVPLHLQTKNMKRLLTGLLLTGCWLGLGAQNDNKVQVELHGFVAVDGVYNTRASKQARNHHIYLYPLPERQHDITGEDLNDRGRFDLDAAHSRFGLHLKGPEWEGLRVSGVLEADFLGDDRGSDADFRLRHAYIKLGRGDWDVTVGQTWHPFFIPENFPQMVNTCAGLPMHPLSRNPQVRLAWQAGSHTELSLTLLEQNNFRTTGFASGSEDAGRPEVVLQVKSGGDGPAWASFTAGYKQLALPEAYDPAGTQPLLKGWHAQATFRYRLQVATFRAGALYGQNISEMVIPGGVGRRSSSSADNPDYLPLATATLWLDADRRMERWDPGIFVGYMQALGASEPVEVVEALSFDAGISQVFTLAPRVKYHFTPRLFAGAEYMYARAGWGQGYDDHGLPVDVLNFSNHRMLFSMRYSF